MAAACDLGGAFDTSIDCAALVLCASALAVKKCLQGDARRWDDFVLDASKQLVGVIWSRWLVVHIVGPGRPSGCDDKWMRSVLDASLGLATEYAALNVFASVVDGVYGETGDYTSGEYRDLDDTFVSNKYLKQLSVWLGCVLFADCVESWLLAMFPGALHGISGAVLLLVSWSRGFQLAFVSLLTPLSSALLQAWLTDDFLQLGGVPVSDVLAAFAAHATRAWELWKADSEGGAALWEAWGQRPLLADGAARSRSRDAPGHASGVVQPRSRDLPRSSGDEAGRSGALSPGGRDPGARGVRRARFEDSPPQAVFPELQAALDGMEFQVARACSASPSTSSSETMKRALNGEAAGSHGALGSHGVMGSLAGAAPSDVGQEPQEQRDPLLQRWRDELKRIDANIHTLATNPEGRLKLSPKLSPIRDAAEPLAPGPAVLAPMWAPSRAAASEALAAPPPPEPTQPTQPTEPLASLYGSGAASGRQGTTVLPPPRPEVRFGAAEPGASPERRPRQASATSTGGFAAAVHGAPWEPVEHVGGHLDGKIAALEAKIDCMMSPQRAQSRGGGQEPTEDGVVRQFLGGPGRPMY